ncbi:MAG: carbohydrate porin, partial [Gammaproteobacteria bacterium]|nr:carbohydrate porin [Gammaproteobacteria bacterium]
MKTALLVLGVAGLALPGVGSAQTQDLDVEIAQLRASLADAKSDYEARIAALEQRLQRAEQLAGSASRDADQAIDIAEQAAIDATSSSSAANTYNPALGAVLVGRFGDVERSWDSIPGFISGGEIGPGGSGFSLGESEINLNANIDPRFFGNLTLAVEDDAGETEIGLEEAWIQTTTLPHGIA